eukprot:1651361-Prymnesium_polylepis.2
MAMPSECVGCFSPSITRRLVRLRLELEVVVAFRLPLPTGAAFQMRMRSPPRLSSPMKKLLAEKKLVITPSRSYTPPFEGFAKRKRS